MRNMSSSPELVDDFAAACDEMVGSKLILAEGKISNVLRAIASSTILFRLFGDAMDEFDFSVEYAKCTANSVGKQSLVFPANRKAHIAMVFTLLVEFDSKRRDLLGFLKDFYFSDDDIGDAYTTFVQTVITAFKRNVMHLLSSEDVDEETVLEEQGEFLAQELMAEVTKNAQQIIASVSKLRGLNILEREDILILCEGLIAATSQRNMKLIRICFVGLKNSLKLKKISDGLDEITSSVENLLEAIG